MLINLFLLDQFDMCFTKHQIPRTKSTAISWSTCADMFILLLLVWLLVKRVTSTSYVESNKVMREGRNCVDSHFFNIYFKTLILTYILKWLSCRGRNLPTIQWEWIRAVTNMFLNRWTFCQSSQIQEAECVIFPNRGGYCFFPDWQREIQRDWVDFDVRQGKRRKISYLQKYQHLMFGIVAPPSPVSNQPPSGH